MRLSLELIVIAIVVLVVAVVVLAIFGGGVQNFNTIFQGQSDQQIKQAICASACANFCMLHPDKDKGVWGTDAGLKDIKYKDKNINCQSIYGECKCKK